MADRKITDLTALPAGNQATGDLLTIVDVSEAAATDKNKKITVGDLLKGIPSNVGIGTTTPGTHLVVQQNDIHDPNFHEDADAAILIKNSASGSGGKSVIKLDNEAALVYGDGSSNLIFSDLSNERLRIDSSGRLLLGTTSPATNAEVTIRAASPQLSLYATPGNASRITLGDTDDYDIGEISYDNSDNSLNFAANAATRMTINSSGVIKHTGSTGADETNKLARYVVPSHDTNEEDVVVFQVENESSSNQITFGGGTSSYNAATQFIFRTASAVDTTTGSERMRIDSSGNVHIAESANARGKLNVFNGDDFDTGTLNNGDNIFLMSDATHGNNVYGASIAFSRTQYPDRKAAAIAAVQTSSDAFHVGLAFFTHSSSNASDPIVEAARIDGSGNLGIGLTSPSSKAHVKGGSITVEHGSPNTGTGRVNINVENDSQATFSYDDEGRIVFGTSTDPSTQAGFSERMRLDSSGRLGIKNSSPGSQYFNDLVIGDGTSDHGITLHAGSSNSSAIAFSDATSGAGRYAGYLQYDHNSNSMRFYLNGGNEHMRLDSSGQAFFYSTGNPITSGTSQGAGTTFEVFTGVHSRSSTTGSGTVCIKVFSNGNIQNTNNSYGQISDVKLKENIVNANSQWDDIKDIQVRNFNFKEETGSPTHTQIGVVAQELETVSPGLVYETPDTDDEGNDLGTVTKSVNYSVLYMKAVKALQEAQARIETLESQHADLLARVTALEAG